VGEQIVVGSSSVLKDESGMFKILRGVQSVVINHLSDIDESCSVLLPQPDGLLL
jgi:hypothetical protein